MFRGSCAAKLRVVSQASGADIARPSPAQGEPSCESSRRPMDNATSRKPTRRNFGIKFSTLIFINYEHTTINTRSRSATKNRGGISTRPIRIPFHTLKPYHEFIVMLRNKRASYRSVAELLGQQGVKTSVARVAEYGRIVLDGKKTRKRRKRTQIIPTATMPAPAQYCRHQLTRQIHFNGHHAVRVLPT